MLKYSLSAVALALLAAPLADGQQYGLNGPIVTHYRPAPQPARLARADDSDSLADLEALESLNPPPEVLGDPPAGSSLLSLEQPDAAPLPRPQAEQIPAPRAVPPPPAPQAPQAAAGQQHASGQRHTGQQHAGQQPVGQQPVVGGQSLGETSVLERFDLQQAMVQQDTAARAAQYYHHGQRGPSGCGCNSGVCSAGHSGHTSHTAPALLPYRQPVLPQGYSFHGYFRADPCHYDIWANYANEAAAACAHSRASLQPKSKQAKPCCKPELVDPCYR